LKKSNHQYLLLFALVLSFVNCKKETSTKSESFSIGIIADCQYCDCEIKWDRYYKKSAHRLNEAVNELNNYDLEYTIHLGDFIDSGFKSYDTVTPIWSKLQSKSYHVLGNHDFDVADSLKHLVPAKMNLKNRYYSFELQNWKFIVLDGNDLSIHGAISKDKIKETEFMFNQVQKDTLPYAKFYNGGLSTDQMKWIKQELNIAKENNLNVGFFCHFPANPIDHHNLWNTEEFLELIATYSNVKLFMNGHNHAGAYIENNGVHYITFKGMVDTENTTSFAQVKFTNDSIFVKGYGREESRTLKLK